MLLAIVQDASVPHSGPTQIIWASVDVGTGSDLVEFVGLDLMGHYYIVHLVAFMSTIPWSLKMLQDFANQVYWWKDYTAACRKAGKKKGVFATPDIAEHMAGQVYMSCLLIVIVKSN